VSTTLVRHKLQASCEIGKAERLIHKLDPSGRQNSWWRALAHCRQEFGCNNYRQALKEARKLNLLMTPANNS
jgi:hypothetical protein